MDRRMAASLDHYLTTPPEDEPEDIDRLSALEVENAELRARAERAEAWQSELATGLVRMAERLLVAERDAAAGRALRAAVDDAAAGSGGNLQWERWADLWRAIDAFDAATAAAGEVAP